MNHKLLVGARLRRLREQRGLNQAAMAERLGLSLSYISQLENNQRPVSAAVLLKLAETFDCDLTEFSQEQDKRLLVELQSLFRDRSLVGEAAAGINLARAVEQAPELAEVLLALAQRHTRLQEEYAQVVDHFYGEQSQPVGAALPPEAVRDFLNRRNNHIERLDETAEQLARNWALPPGQRCAPLRALLKSDYRIEVLLAAPDAAGDTLRRYDPRRRTLWLPTTLSDGQLAFQMLTQLALLGEACDIDAELRDAGLDDAESRGLARLGLAHYFAGAVLMPYGDLLATARELRYDIEALQQRWHVGFESVCHRLSTLQRPGARGVPFYFVRVDQAGNISKRQSATTFHFARQGGACPLWHVHEAFSQPGRILTQVAEMPDGTRFFGIARTIERGGGGWLARRKHFAIGLGCEISHARALVYADGLTLTDPRRIVPIGPGCRVCPRERCVQRAFPPAGKRIEVSAEMESLESYRFG